MENLTAIDAGAAVIILISAVLAFSRGLVRELMAILGWIGAAVAAFYFAPSVQPLVKELPVVGEFLSESCELSVVAGARLDGEPIPVLRANMMFRAVEVPAGRHEVIMLYRPACLFAGLMVTLVGVVLMLVYCTRRPVVA